MTTRLHRSRAARAGLAVLLCTVAMAAVPQQPPAAPPAATTPPPAATAPPPATESPPATPPKPAPKAPAGTPSPTRFEPTDKVRADFDVSFPIDI